MGIKLGFTTTHDYMRALKSGMSPDEITMWNAPEPSNSVSINYENIFKYIAKRFNQVPTVEHKCHNCGGTLDINPNEGIFKCPYCRSVYAIGTTRINDRG